MKKIRWCQTVTFLVFLTVGGMTSHGAEPSSSQLLRILDPVTDLKALARMVENTGFNPASFRKFILIDGSIAGITVLDPNPKTFTAELEVVQGEWVRTEDVKLYRAYVYLQGPSFASMLPATLKANDYVLVLGYLEEVYTDDGGRRYPVVVALSIRKLP